MHACLPCQSANRGLVNECMTRSRAGGTDMAHGSEPVRVGMIANPVSARDVRRVLSDAAGLTLGERVAMLLRVLRVLASMGVDEVLLVGGQTFIHLCFTLTAGHVACSDVELVCQSASTVSLGPSIGVGAATLVSMVMPSENTSRSRM